MIVVIVEKEVMYSDAFDEMFLNFGASVFCLGFLGGPLLDGSGSDVLLR